MKSLLLIFSIFSLLACSASKDTDKNSGIFDLANLEGSCELDLSKFKDILEEDISKDITCLKDSLGQFSSGVETEEPDFIRQSELEEFVKDFYPESLETTKKALPPIFRLNNLLFKDPIEKISVKNIDLIFQLLGVINTHGQKVWKITKKIERNKYWFLRDSFHDEIVNFVDSAFAIIKKKRPQGYSIDTEVFLEEVKFLFGFEDEKFDLTFIKSLLSVKKIMVGGERLSFSDHDLIRFLEKAAGTVVGIVDMIYLSEKKFSDEIEKRKFNLLAVRSLEAYIFKNVSPTEPIFYHEDILIVGKKLFKEINWDKISLDIQFLKEKVIGGGKDLYTHQDLLSVVKLVLESFEVSLFSKVTFNHFKKKMLSHGKITLPERPELKRYKYFSSERVNEMWLDFLIIAKNYHLFLNKDKMQIYDYRIYRDSYGMTVLSLSRWFLRKFFFAYGHIDPFLRNGDFVLNKGEMKKLALNYKNILKEVNFWPDDLDRLIDELIFGADIFRINSNGDLVVELDEVNEYFSQVLGSAKTGERIEKGLSKYCKKIEKKNTLGEVRSTFKIDCYRMNFFKVFFEDTKHKEYYENLYQFSKTKDLDYQIEFLKKLEIKGRIENDPTMPIDRTDLSRLVTSISNIETFIIRFDKNKNHVLDFEELEKVFEHIKNLIPNVEGVKESLVKSYFFYIVKNKKIPTTLKHLWFHYLGGKSKIKGDRLSVATVISLF